MMALTFFFKCEQAFTQLLSSVIESNLTFLIITFQLQDLEVASDPYIAAILVGLIRLIGSFLGTLLLKKFKRKVLMMSSAILMALMLAALAATVYYKDQIQQQPSTSEEEEASKSLFEKGLVYALKVLPLAEMILYILFFGLGVGTVPWLLLGITISYILSALNNRVT